MEEAKTIEINGRTFNVKVIDGYDEYIEIEDLREIATSYNEAKSAIDDMWRYTISQLYEDSRKCAEIGELSPDGKRLSVYTSDNGTIDIEVRVHYLDEAARGDIYMNVHDDDMYRDEDDDDDEKANDNTEYNEIVCGFHNFRIRRKMVDYELYDFDELMEVDREAYFKLNCED